MNTIINNPNNLTDEQLDIKTNKVRAIIINDANEIILTKYTDIYMLPGGKVDCGEKEQEALKRELNEELGIDIRDDNITPLIKIIDYLKDYPNRNTKDKSNKLTTTTYYVIKSNVDINMERSHLTENENEGNFNIYKVSLENIRDILLNHHSKNIRNQYFQRDILQVLEEYKKSFLAKLITRLSAFLVKPPAKEEDSDQLIDMHTHSCYSDGDLTPNELLSLAKSKGIGTISLTDHDTLLGNRNCQNSQALKGIKFISGIELSAKTDIGRMHILGYGIDINNYALNKKMKDLKNNSVNYVLSIMEQIKKDYGIKFTYDEIKELINANHNFGRPDVARLLVKNGYAVNVPNAFDKYLDEAYSKVQSYGKGIPYEECIELILRSGGIPVLAHLNSLKRNDFELTNLIKDMQRVGLGGIEVYHFSYSIEETKRYFDIANNLNLFISGGTDFHGVSVRPDVEIGTGKNNNIKIKQLSLLNALNKML